MFRGLQDLIPGWEREGERDRERMREMSDSPLFEVGHNEIIGT